MAILFRPRACVLPIAVNLTRILSPDPFWFLNILYEFGGRTVADLCGRCYEAERTGAERVLYLLHDKEASFQRVADIANVVRHLRAASVSERPVPKELRRTTGELMNIQIRLVTAPAMDAPCPKGYFNWATQGFPVMP